MYPGYIRIGGSTITDGAGDELVNNERTYSYAQHAGLWWLRNCDPCENLPIEGPWVSPVADPAPWYTSLNYNSAGFYGIYGLEVVGDNTGTRSATVTNTLKLGSVTGGAVIGRTYYGPRTLLFRLLLVAQNDCALEYGLNWLDLMLKEGDPLCSGTNLWFLDCCPDCFTETPLQCGTYKPHTAAPPPFDCATPHIRHFQDLRFTSGPTIIYRPDMGSSGGAMAEVEITAVAGDPTRYGATVSLLAFQAEGGEPLAMMATRALAPQDPFAAGLPQPEPLEAFGSEPLLPLPDEWLRTTVPLDVTLLPVSVFSPVLRITNRDTPTGRVRVGIWDGSQLVQGFSFPYIPEGRSVTIDSQTHTVFSDDDGTVQPLAGFAKDYEGFSLRYMNLPTGDYTVTVDNEAGFPALLDVEVDAVLVPV